MGKYIPKGMIAALVTPFNQDESINFEEYKKLIDYVIEGRIHCILTAGGTGEYRTMTHEEHKAIIKAACEHNAGRVPVMAGACMYTAKATIEMVNYAADCGADCALVLPPYYQHTTRQGIIQFFREIAEGSKIGIVVYNNPGGTAVPLDAELVYELAQIPNIVALKDTDDQMHTCETIRLTRDVKDFAVLHGFEHLMLPSLVVGASGATGILHNLVPKEIVKLYDLMQENNWKEACELNAKLMNLYKYMELEPYPGPVKAGLELVGIKAGPVRAPLTQTSDELREKIRIELKALGYNV